VLESKLTEFHGSLAPAVLPSKKLLSPNFQFLDEKKAEFEWFLKVSLFLHSLLVLALLLYQNRGLKPRGLSVEA